jgi:plastocyanin
MPRRTASCRRHWITQIRAVVQPEQMGTPVAARSGYAKKRRFRSRAGGNKFIDSFVEVSAGDTITAEDYVHGVGQPFKRLREGE